VSVYRGGTKSRGGCERSLNHNQKREGKKNRKGRRSKSQPGKKIGAKKEKRLWGRRILREGVHAKRKIPDKGPMEEKERLEENQR